MNDTVTRLAALGVRAPDVLLPKAGTDLSKWAVIACDQFTQDRDYWERAGGLAGDAPSTLRLIFPEVYLDDRDKGERVLSIHRTMRLYRERVFAPARRGVIYIERSLPQGGVRRGLALALDLEAYDWRPGARTLIRATEGTVPERLPPRMDIRRGAPLETPHVIALINDREDRLLPLLGSMAKAGPGGAAKAPLYDTDLMLGGGHVTGWALDGSGEEALAAGLERLDGEAAGVEAAGEGDAKGAVAPFLFAVGDGNHSLATAKAVWEERKKAGKAGEAGAAGADSPARYAMVEVENLYDPGVRFEPIHRVIFNIEPDDALTLLKGLQGFRCRPAGDRCLAIESEGAGAALVTPGLEPLLRGLEVDYLHGEEEVRRVARQRGRPAVGLLLPPLRKEGLFETVSRTGPLPRKSFSLGEAEEKRYYLECRLL